jgi:glycosyltransferase involved in cell wall biosynthesis
LLCCKPEPTALAPSQAVAASPDPAWVGASPRDAGGPLNVLLVNSLYAPYVVGGAEIVTEMLASNLAMDGHGVTVVTSCSASEGMSRSQIDGVDVIRFFPKNLWWLYERFAPGDRRSALAKLRWRFRDAWNRDVAHRFAAILDAIRPDIVHTHNFKGFSPVIWQEAHRQGIPVVHTGHSYEMICVNGSLLKPDGDVCGAAVRCWPCRLQGHWFRRQVKAVDVFCSPSRYLLDIHRVAGIEPDRVARVPNGVPRKTTPARRRRLPDAPRHVLYMGQLADHKGVAVLLDALRILQGLRFTLDIAGKGPLEGMVAAGAESDDRIRFHGFVDAERKQALFAAADALVFPSVWVENSPMAIIEAFCAGIPVIGSDIGAIPELVKHDFNGLLFDAGSAAGLARCISTFVTSPSVLERLERGAESSGECLATPQEMTAEYLKIYRSLLRAVGASPSSGRNRSAPVEASS